MPVLNANMAAVSAGASAVAAELGTVPTFEGVDQTVVRVTYVPQTTQASEGATNFATLQIRDTTKSNQVIASLNLGTTGVTAETPVVLTVSSGVVAEGDNLDAYVSQTGTGGAVPAGNIEIELN